MSTSLRRTTVSEDNEVHSNDAADEVPYSFDAEIDNAINNNEPINESAVSIRHCAHIFGSTCLTAWFALDTSNRCPECNQALFPARSFHLVLDHPARQARIRFAQLVEDELEDPETANHIRSQLMSEYTKMLMRHLAIEVHVARGYDNVTWKYRDLQEEEEESDNEEEEITEDLEKVDIYGDDEDEEEEMKECDETEDEKDA